MKKIFVTIFTTLLFILVLPLGNNFKHVEAASYYPMACSANEFEVSYVENDGSLSKVSCHSNFPDAKKAMKANEDYVVRYEKSYSPTKIIAMNSGLAYTYPGRRNSLTMYIYQNASVGSSNQNKYKYTYLTENYEMNYYDTLTDYSDSLKEYGKGFIKVSMNGFDGYCELEYTDLVPMKYIEKSIAIYLGGNNTYNGESAYRVKLSQNYYSIESKGNYKDLVFHYNMSYPDKYEDGLSCIANSIRIDNAKNYLDAGMKTGVKYYSNDGINFYSDRKLTKFVAQVYGYYQYLSVRSKTNISAKTFDAFLKSMKSSSQMMDEGQAFINAQNNYGSNALIIYAMACQESGYGTSYYSSDRYNLFGWGAYDSNPGNASKYESIEQCVNQQMGRNLDWFMDCTNWRYAGTCVGNKGTGFNMQYASDPYWGAKIAAIAYNIDKYSCNNNGKLTDYNNYTIAVVDHNYNPCFGIDTSNWKTPIYKKSSGTSVLHYSKFNDNYQKDLTIAITEKVGNRYKINLANPMVNGALYVDSDIVKYDWNTSVGYIDCDKVSLINASKQEEQKGEATYKPYNAIYEMKLDGNKLSINGLGVIQGTDFKVNNDSIKHEIVFYNFENNEEVYSYLASNDDSDGYSMNDGYDYTYSGFSADIDLDNENLGLGSYYISLRTTNSEHVVEETLRTSNSKNRNKVSNKDGVTYLLNANPLSSYRLELDIVSSPIDYTTINKPSARTSMAAFDSIAFDENGDLNIIGEGLIHYLDFNDKRNIQFNVYLVQDDNSYLKLNTSLRDDDTDYTSALNSEYDLSYISFIATTEGLENKVTDLNDGKYQLVLEIVNKQGAIKYIDYVEMTNRSGMKFNSTSTDVKTAEIITSNVRKKVMIDVETIETGE